MKKSKLRKNPRRIARERIIEKFNRSPGGLRHVRHTVFTRLADPEMARLNFAIDGDTTLQGWHQEGQNLIALYERRGALVMFDRFLNGDELDTIISVAAASSADLSHATSMLNETQAQVLDTAMLFEADDE